MQNPSNPTPVPDTIVDDKLPHLGKPKSRQVAECMEIIDVESFEPEHTPQLSKKSVTECQGHRIIIPDGRSPHSTYPLALHDARTLPWTCTFDDRGLTLFAWACSGKSVEHLDSCQPCQELVKNSSLEGILTRMKEGVHANSPHAYYGFSGLQEIIQRKDLQIEFYRFRGLNQAKNLLGKAAALSDQK
jgi:hypothetical protein